jgi:hypothetical protein
MTKRILLLAAPIALLAGCGSTSDTTNAITTGSYAVSGGTATAAFPTDNCNMVPLFTTGNPPIYVLVNGTAARFDLEGGHTLTQYFTTASINGNAIDHVTDANFLTVVGATCTFRTHVQVRGEIVGNDDMHLVAKYDISNESGSACTIADVDVKVLPCTSEVDFLARK